MGLSSPENNAAYFGFTDLPGFKDYVVYVLSCAPDLFPEEEWRRPEEQMNLERAFVGLRLGLNILAQQTDDSALLDECTKLVDEAGAQYHAGQDHAGQSKLEELERILGKLHVR
jgi:hypothetical protein